MRRGISHSAGPRLVFFTGGTALRQVSRQLPNYTSNSVHLVTPFDSGGSTAALRKAFGMPAMGDIRNRLLALADAALVPGAVFDFCEQRLPLCGTVAEQRAALLSMGKAEHPVWDGMPDAFADILRRHLCHFLARMPDDFDPHGANLGNLLLTGGYLENGRDFGPTLKLFGEVFNLRGEVYPVVNESLHLACELDDGSRVVGQHLFKALPGRIRRLFLTAHEPGCPCPPAEESSRRPPLSPDAVAGLGTADLICYPMGSFYTSVLANLLPQGVGKAVAAADCPKVFIPNSGSDAELRGLSLPEQVDALLGALWDDAPEAPVERLLQHVLVDGRHGRYEGGFGADVRDSLARRGVRVLDAPIVQKDDPQRHEPDCTIRALLGFLP